MSTADIAAIVIGADYAATLVAGTILLKPLADRLRGSARPRAAASPEATRRPVAPLPAGEAPRRREEFARLRAEEGKSVEEAAAAVNIAPRTARRYEAERQKPVSGTDGDS